MNAAQLRAWIISGMRARGALDKATERDIDDIVRMLTGGRGADTESDEGNQDVSELPCQVGVCRNKKPKLSP